MSPAESAESNQASHYQHVGLYLREVREHFRLSIADVSSRLHIRAKYIQAIESGDFTALPAKVYAQGYLQNYAEFLGLDPDAILQEFEQASMAAPAKPVQPVEPTKQLGLPSRRWVLLGGVLLIVLAFWLKPEMHEKPVAALKSTIESVPESMRGPDGDAMHVTPRNRDCLRGSFATLYPACYPFDINAVRGPFEVRLPESLMMQQP